MLDWRSLVNPHDRKFMVKGTELSQAIVPGYLSRFALYEVRRFDVDMMPDVFFRIRDADTVTDDEINAGIRPKPVIEGRDFGAVLAKIDEICPKHVDIYE